MLYKPGEIAEEIGVSPDTIYRSYLPAGAPHDRDPKGNIWIHGPAFRAWVLETIGTKRAAPKHPMREDEAWCMRCNGVVTIANPKPKKLNRYADLLQGKCAVCGTKINRAISKKPVAQKTTTTRSEFHD